MPPKESLLGGITGRKPSDNDSKPVSKPPVDPNSKPSSGSSAVQPKPPAEKREGLVGGLLGRKVSQPSKPSFPELERFDRAREEAAATASLPRPPSRGSSPKAGDVKVAASYPTSGGYGQKVDQTAPAPVSNVPPKAGLDCFESHLLHVSSDDINERSIAAAKREVKQLRAMKHALDSGDVGAITSYLLSTQPRKQALAFADNVCARIAASSQDSQPETEVNDEDHSLKQTQAVEDSIWTSARFSSIMHRCIDAVVTPETAEALCEQTEERALQIAGSFARKRPPEGVEQITLLQSALSMLLSTSCRCSEVAPKGVVSILKDLAGIPSAVVQGCNLDLRIELSAACAVQMALLHAIVWPDRLSIVYSSPLCGPHVKNAVGMLGATLRTLPLQAAGTLDVAMLRRLVETDRRIRPSVQIVIVVTWGVGPLKPVADLCDELSIALHVELGQAHILGASSALKGEASLQRANSFTVILPQFSGGKGSGNCTTIVALRKGSAGAHAGTDNAGTSLIVKRLFEAGGHSSKTADASVYERVGADMWLLQQIAAERMVAIGKKLLQDSAAFAKGLGKDFEVLSISGTSVVFLCKPHKECWADAAFDSLLNLRVASVVKRQGVSSITWSGRIVLCAECDGSTKLISAADLRAKAVKIASELRPDAEAAAFLKRCQQQAKDGIDPSDSSDEYLLSHSASSSLACLDPELSAKTVGALCTLVSVARHYDHMREAPLEIERGDLLLFAGPCARIAWTHHADSHLNNSLAALLDFITSPLPIEQALRALEKCPAYVRHGVFAFAVSCAFRFGLLEEGVEDLSACDLIAEARSALCIERGKADACAALVLATEQLAKASTDESSERAEIISVAEGRVSLAAAGVLDHRIGPGCANFAAPLMRFDGFKTDPSTSLVLESGSIGVVEAIRNAFDH